MYDRLAEVDRDFIKNQVESGFYTSDIEVVRDALRKMRESENKKQELETLRALLMVGHNQAVKGEVIEYSDSFVTDALERARANQKAGKSIKNEIKPD